MAILQNDGCCDGDQKETYAEEMERRRKRKMGSIRDKFSWPP